MSDYKVLPHPGAIHFEGKQREKLGSLKNLAIIGAFCFFHGFPMIAFLVWYLRTWRLAVIYVNLASIIDLIPTTYLTVLIGYFGDIYVSKYGRRKPLIIAGIILEVIAVFCLANPISLDQMTMFWWYTLWLVVYDCASVAVLIPLRSWLVESSIDDKDFLQLTTVAVTGGVICGSIFGIILSLKRNSGTIAALFSIGIILTSLLLIAFVPNEVRRHTKLHYQLIPSVRICMRTRNFQILFFCKSLARTGPVVQVAVAHFYIMMGYTQLEYYSEAATYLILTSVLALFALGIVSVFLSFLLKKFDKLSVYRALLLFLAVIGIALFPTTTQHDRRHFYLFSLLSMLVYIVSGSMTIIEELFIRDLTLLDTILNNTYRESGYQTAIHLPTSLATQLLSILPKIVLFASGLVSGTNTVNDDHIVSKFLWNDTALVEMQIFCSFFVTVMALLAYAVMRKYELRDDVTGKLSLILEEKRRQSIEASHEVVTIPTKESSYYTENSVVAFEENPADDPESNDFESLRMLFLHFDANEINLIFHFANSAIKTIIQILGASITMSIVAIGLLLACLSHLIIFDQNSLSILYLTLILMLSLYVLYEALRIRAICIIRQKLPEIAKLEPTVFMKSIHLDADYIDANLHDKIFSPVRTEQESTLSAMHAPTSSPTFFSTINDTMCYYKYVFLSLSFVIILGVLGNSVISISNREPEAHSPTFQPTMSPI